MHVVVIIDHYLWRNYCDEVELDNNDDMNIDAIGGALSDYLLQRFSTGFSCRAEEVSFITDALSVLGMSIELDTQQTTISKTIQYFIHVGDVYMATFSGIFITYRDILDIRPVPYCFHQSGWEFHGFIITYSGL